MGGGDLNSKKSWHPNTLKNQERVWKAEQVAADEKKRIVELQQERSEERDRFELNELARNNAASTSDNRLDWMYNKPDKKVQQEEYLLGKAIDKNFAQTGKPEQNEIPAVARRLVGSSMVSTASDVQVDLARKIREDPLVLVKERERAARAALLNNPVQRKKLTELLRREQELNKDQNVKKKKKKKDIDLDNKLAAKLNVLSSNNMDLAKLLESDDSSDSIDSFDEESNKTKKEKKNKKHKHKTRKVEKSRKKNKEKVKERRLNEQMSLDSHSSAESKKQGKNHINSSSDKETLSHNIKHKDSKYQHFFNTDNKEKIDTKYRRYDRDSDMWRNNTIEKTHNNKEYNLYQKVDKEKSNKRSSSCDGCQSKRKKYIESKSHDRIKTSKKSDLSDKEKAARLAEMIVAGTEREVQRGRRVAKQIAENSAVEKISASRIPSRNEALALPDSLASRIHSNRHYIQRNERHMHEHFARR